jgi:transcription initiation factor TFIIIB Brf1 subunit/transcription initiation factor TFIIB
MDRKYSQYKSMANAKDVGDIVSICKTLGVPQKSIYSTVEIYYRYAVATQRCENIISVVSACVMLAGKITNTLRSLQKILHACHEYYNVEDDEEAFEENYRDAISIELNICIAIDFDFQVSDFYGCLEKLCGECCIDKGRAQTIWIILNDTVYLPLVLAFCARSVVVSCMFIACMIDECRANRMCDLSLFKHKHRNIDFDISDVLFVTGEIISLYENFSKSTKMGIPGDGP